MTVTVVPVVVFKPLAGFQLYVLAPLAVKLNDLPAQIVVDVGVTATVGVAFTVTELVVVAVHVPNVSVMV